MRRRLKTAIFYAALPLIAGVAIEAPLRLIGYLWTKVPHARPPHTKWHSENEIWGVWHQPNARVRNAEQCFDVTYSANEFGMRDKPRRLEKTKPRIAVLGDSFTEGWGVDDGRNFTSILENEHFGGKIEVLNFGTSGVFGTTQEWLLYKQLARRFKPDLVVVAFLNNDVSDNSWPVWKTRDPCRRRPYLIKNEGGGFDLFYPPACIAGRASPFLEDGTESFLESHSFLARLIGETLHRSRSVEPADFSGIFGDRPTDAWRKDWETTLQAFLRLKAEVAADGSKLMIVNLVDAAQMDPESAPYPERGKDMDVLAVNKRLETFAKTNGIEYFSLYPYFKDYRDRRRLKSPYFSLSCDDHWSELGHRTAAAALAEYLRGRFGRALKIRHPGRIR
ncbi:MAG: SGNH/GDSL hydrolase family protein [Elusimicrobiota bacterium]